MAFELPALPYPNNARSRTLTEQTMMIHHDRHHATYVNNLNKAIEGHPQPGKQNDRGIDSPILTAYRKIFALPFATTEADTPTTLFSGKSCPQWRRKAERWFGGSHQQ